MRIRTMAALAALVLVSWPGCNRPTSKPPRQARPVQRKPEPSGPSESEQKILDAVAYLDEIEEVAWHDVHGNDIYIGFYTQPADLQTICKGAALNANRAIGRGAHVWAVVGVKKGWHPSYNRKPSAYHCTARYGRIE